MFCKKALPIVRKLAVYFDETLLKFVDLAIGITTRLRWLITTDSEHPNQILEFVLERIPEKHRVAASVALATALDTFTQMKQCHTDNERLEDVIKCYVKVIKAMPKEVQDAETLKLASIIAKWMDNRFFSHIYDTAVQLRVTENILNEND